MCQECVSSDINGPFPRRVIRQTLRIPAHLDTSREGRQKM